VEKITVIFEDEDVNALRAIAADKHKGKISVVVRKACAEYITRYLGNKAAAETRAQRKLAE